MIEIKEVTLDELKSEGFPVYPEVFFEQNDNELHFLSMIISDDNYARLIRIVNDDKDSTLSQKLSKILGYVEKLKKMKFNYELHKQVKEYDYVIRYIKVKQ